MKTITFLFYTTPAVMVVALYYLYEPVVWNEILNHISMAIELIRKG